MTQHALILRCEDTKADHESPMRSEMRSKDALRGSRSSCGRKYILSETSSIPPDSLN